MSEIVFTELIAKVSAIQKDLAELKQWGKSQTTNQEVLEHLNKRLDALQPVIQKIEPAIQGSIQAGADTKAEIQALKKLIYDLPGQLSLPRNAIDALRKELMDHSQLLSIPVKQNIKHHHYLTRPILIGIGLVMLVLMLMVVLVDGLLRH